MPSARLQQLAADLQRSRDLVGLGQAIGSLTVGRVDASDLYRAALVNAVGAVDAYARGVVLDRALRILLGREFGGATDRKLGLPFGAVGAIVGAQSPAEQEMAARTHLAERLALETFQKPDDIARAFAYVGVGRVWSAAFADDAAAKKEELSLIVRRRDAIVHTCDVDPLNAGNVKPLSASDAIFAIAKIWEICDGIDRLC